MLATKRYYPFGNLASQVIGFCGSDNQGLDGIEARYDSTLKGEYGRIEKVIDATGGKSNSASESYVEAVDGKDLVLTIDMTVQSIAEKYLKNACIDNECTDGGNVIIMNPKTGDILAMAGYPNYNLNEPYEPYTDDLKQNWSDKDFAKIALMIYDSGKLMPAMRPNTFKSWYEKFCGLVGCRFHKDYKPSILNPDDNLRRIFYYLQ